MVGGGGSGEPVPDGGCVSRGPIHQLGLCGSTLSSRTFLGRPVSCQPMGISVSWAHKEGFHWDFPMIKVFPEDGNRILGKKKKNLPELSY